MRVGAIAVMSCLLVLTVGALLIRARRAVGAMDARLARRGIVRARDADGRDCHAGVLNGGGVCFRESSELNRGPNSDENWLVVTASRNHALVHAGLALPVQTEAASAAAEPAAPLTPAESERAAHAALVELQQGGIELERSGDLVRVRVACEANAEVVERVIDVACAWVAHLRPAPAPKVSAPSSWTPVIEGALLLAHPLALFLGGFSPIFSDTIAHVLEHVCDHGDRLLVFSEQAAQGTGYDVYCVTAAGERYGCIPVWAAGYDLVFPFVFAGAVALFWLRRKPRKRVQP